jgi:hypothetical protein
LIGVALAGEPCIATYADGYEAQQRTRAFSGDFANVLFLQVLNSSPARRVVDVSSPILVTIR